MIGCWIVIALLLWPVAILLVCGFMHVATKTPTPRREKHHGHQTDKSDIHAGHCGHN